jgi:endonuclease/exonuclease/phosphatase family metal-dependent hydrolase
MLIVGGVACAAPAADENADGSEAAATEAGNGVHHPPTSTAADFVNGDSACPDVMSGTHATPISPDTLAADEPLLSKTGSIPLPSMGPAADGFFWPSKGYIEGGHFSSATGRAEQEVDASLIQAAAPAGSLRVVEFNVNRGTKLDDLVKVMKKMNADVYLVIETDLYNLNSSLPSEDPNTPAKRVVVGREMARALGGEQGYYYVTGTEFYERLTPGGTNKDAAMKKLAPLNDITGSGRMGMSGHAIISRYPITAAQRVDVPMYLSRGGHDWSTERPGLFSSTFNELLRSDDLQPQPRCGQRMALSATISVPGAGDMKFVALHTENKSNAGIRADQFDYVLYGGKTPLLSTDQSELAIIAGDLNTLSFGEGGSFRSHLKNADSLIDTSSAVSPVNEQKTDAFGRIDWMIQQPGSSQLPVQSYAVGDNEGASDHQPVIVELGLPK